MSSVAELLSDAVGQWTLAPERSRFEFTNKTMWGHQESLANGGFQDPTFGVMASVAAAVRQIRPW